VQAQYDALCAQIRGLPSHLDIHNGGMILTAYRSVLHGTARAW